ncbi:MAG: hypothetical protein LQ345_007060 [Seirophora villosa]|nr:MAG: hypothetical protein LQ345_007060 [Seirophora villosa]
MKSFIISAVMGIASVGLLCGNAAGAPTDAGKAPPAHLTSYLLHQADTSTTAVKRDAQGVLMDKSIAPSGSVKRKDSAGLPPTDKYTAPLTTVKLKDSARRVLMDKSIAPSKSVKLRDSVGLPQTDKYTALWASVKLRGSAGLPPTAKYTARRTNVKLNLTVPQWNVNAIYCLNAMVFFGNITLETFRELNPDVNTNCTNLKPCGSLSSNASAVDSSPQPLLPAIRATEMSFGSGGRVSSKCIPATGMAGPSGTLYDVDTAGVTCQTRVIPVSTTHSSGPVTHTATVSISGRPITVTYVDNPHILASTTPGRPSTVSFEAASEPHHVNTASSKPLSSQHGTLPANAPSATPAENAHVGAPGYKFL